MALVRFLVAPGTLLCADPFWSHELLGNLKPVKTIQGSRRIDPWDPPEIGFMEAVASFLDAHCSFAMKAASDVA